MVRRHSSVTEIPEDVHLAAMGHTQELKRTFSPLAMLGLAFAILNSWTALATSLSLALPSGGPTSVLWGLITAGICNLCLAASLAEFLSVWPSAGGQCKLQKSIPFSGQTRMVSELGMYSQVRLVKKQCMIGKTVLTVRSSRSLGSCAVSQE